MGVGIETTACPIQNITKKGTYVVRSRNCCCSGNSILPSLFVVDLHVECFTTIILWRIDVARNDKKYLFIHVKMSDICV